MNFAELFGNLFKPKVSKNPWEKRPREFGAHHGPTVLPQHGRGTVKLDQLGLRRHGVKHMRAVRSREQRI